MKLRSKRQSLTPNHVVRMAIRNSLSADFAIEILNAAIAHFPSASSVSRQVFQRMLREQSGMLKIPGFAFDASKALKDRQGQHLIAQKLLRLIRLDFVLEALIPLWEDAHPALREAVRDYLIAREIPVHESVLSTHFAGEWTVAEEVTIAEEFVASHPDYCFNKACLMVFCQAALVPLPNEAVTTNAGEIETQNEQETEETPDVDWEKWLMPWQHLSFDAPEWDHLDSFLSALNQLAKSRQNERNAGRQRLKQVLDVLNEMQADDSLPGQSLDFFELTAEHWCAEACPLAEMDAAILAIQHLIEMLNQYGTLYNQKDKDAPARRKRNQDLDALDVTVREQHDLIDRLLTTQTPPSNDQEDQDQRQEPDDTENQIDDPLASSVVAAITRHDVGNVTDEYEEDLETAASNDSTNEGLAVQVEPELHLVHDENGNTIPLQVADDVTISVHAPVDDTLNIVHEIDAGAEPVPILDIQPLPQPDIAVTTASAPASFISHDVLWELLDHEDYTGAYVLAHALEESGEQPPIPSGLLAAYQGAQWMHFETDQLRSDVQSIALTYVPQDDPDLKCMGFAAALLPAILSHDNLFSSWLAGRPEYGVVGELIDAVRQFAMGNQALPADCLDGVSPAQTNMALQEAAKRAAEWLQSASNQSHDIVQSRRVWDRLTKNDGQVARLLNPVSGNRKAEVTIVRQMLATMERREDIQKIVTAIGRSQQRGRDMILEGDRRDALIRHVQEAVGIARDWCALVELELQQDKTWFAQRISVLFEQLRMNLPKACIALEAQQSEAPSLAKRISARCLRRALYHLATVLSLQVSLPPMMPEPDVPASDWWGCIECEEEVTLLSALNRRLLWFPEITLDKDRATRELVMPAPSMLSAGLPLHPPTLTSLQIALQQWRDNQDFRFEELILRAFRDDDTTQQLRHQGQEKMAQAKTNLDSTKQRYLKENERALRDGVLLDEEYTDFDERLKAISSGAPNARQELARMEAINEKIQAARRKRSQVQQQIWVEIQKALQDKTEPRVWDKIDQRIREFLDKHDSRNTDYILAELRECRDTGQPPDDEWLAAHLPGAASERQTDASSPLDDFRRHEKQLTDVLRENPPRSLGLLLQAVASQKNWNGLDYSNVSRERLKEAGNAITEWKALKEKRASSIEDKDLTAMETLLSYLGFTRSRGMDPLRVRSQDRDWIHVTAQMSAGEESVRSIPQFGSTAERDGYHIVCFWDRLEAVAISTRLENLRLNSESILIFYFGSLRMQQRQALAEMARKRKLSIALLDETLLAFLATQRDNRLRAFLCCTLPFSAANPYTPDRAGAVPKEMFFGRSDMVDSLMKPDGSCIVYGGRQLGKSALLVDTQRRFHMPEQQRFAWIEDIRLTGDSALCIQKPEALYRRLYECFVQHNLLKGPLLADSDMIITRIKEVLVKHPERRVLVMYDEADNFLEADARKNFPIVTSLRQLMDATNRRFKVVFTGLHHVQRFRHYSNQPLTHFGAPILVGPLAPQDAQQLVREPLEVLGFRINDAEVMRVLSHTNRHPGLIQKYCFELLKKLYNPMHQASPPMDVSQNTVEAVYLDGDVRSLIATRFEDTLNLDARYRMIAYAIIVEQMSDRDSYAHVYHDYEILELVQCYNAALFAETNTDEMRSLLEEMCGLGVLIHVRDQGGYRLRSPNLVRLLGTEQSIEQRLVDLAATTPHDDGGTESSHAPLTVDLTLYSPLTGAQEFALNGEQNAFSLIFASDAQDLLQLPATLRAFLPAELQQGSRHFAHIEQMPSRCAGESEVKNWLLQLAQANRTTERLIVYQHVSHTITGLEKRIRAAMQFCAEYTPRHTAGQWVRIFFLFDPESTNGWLTLPTVQREDFENAAAASTWPHVWNAFGIRQRLQQLELSTDPVNAIIEATGGWHYLVEEFFKRYGKTAHRDNALALKRELNQANSAINADFKRKVGLVVNTPAWRVWSFVHRMQSDIGLEPELIEIDNLSLIECKNALLWLERMGCLTRHHDQVRTDRFLSECFIEELR